MKQIAALLLALFVMEAAYCAFHRKPRPIALPDHPAEIVPSVRARLPCYHVWTRQCFNPNAHKWRVVHTENA